MPKKPQTTEESQTVITPVNGERFQLRALLGDNDGTKSKAKELIPKELDLTLVQKATKALLTHHKRSQALKEKIAPVVCVYMTISVVKLPQLGFQKSFQIRVANPFRQNSDICVVVPSPIPANYKELLSGLPGMKILPIAKLSALDQKARLNFLKRYSLIICDKPITQSLTNLVGRAFMESKKGAEEVTFDKRIQYKIARLRDSTPLWKPTGTSINIIIGTTNQTQEELQENVVSIIDYAPHLFSGWKNIHSMFLKTPDSIALPVYQNPKLTSK